MPNSSSTARVLAQGGTTPAAPTGSSLRGLKVIDGKAGPLAMQDSEFAEVLAAAQAGAEWAWARLYRSEAGKILGYLRYRGAIDAENLVGEVFLQVARNIRAFNGSYLQFRSWLFTIAYHCLLDERRAARRRPTLPVAEFDDEEAGPDATADTALTAIETGRVERMLARLVPAQQEVLLLRVVGGLSTPEIAEVLGKKVGAVKALQRRGLEALRRMIEREGVSL